MRQHLPIIGLALLAWLLFLIASGTIGEVVVVPLLLLWWVARVLYASVPQALLWGVFVAIAVLLLAKSLAWRNAPLSIAGSNAVAHGRVANWSTWLRDSSRNDHARWRLAQRLSELAIELLAFREQCPPHEIQWRLEHGSLDVPPEMRAYLRIGRSPYVPRPKPRRLEHETIIIAKAVRDRVFRALQSRSRSSQLEYPVDVLAHPPHTNPLDVDPVLVIDYLEETLQRTIGASR
ncbi:MAG TPA: hypothetical protein VKE41_14505 [Roseiflexaceae bacterium]|nr:hypothetical protein [Roseiflexaceae bacterium]